MSEQFKKGQLVAVRDYNGAKWNLRVYDHERGGRHYCRIVDGLGTVGGIWWAQVCPAEIVWPNIFLSCDREIIDRLRQELDKERQIAKQNIFAVELEQELVQRLRSQIRWLCERLQAIGDRNGEQECPPSPYHDCRRGSCADCWEQASLEAVKEGADGTSEETSQMGR